MTALLYFAVGAAVVRAMKACERKSGDAGLETPQCAAGAIALWPLYLLWAIFQW